ncbi:putative nuclease HARBI1 isoform X2 [Bombina bombina]|uniref:putative nuclease HARBI1 isoform X2 n=1 Tax=Bombina bombina TaxID=8345 RepID=UPI00235AC5AF|nr:putative nuclease HARBI1 isoform X2 [Bombina bombina]
MDADLLAVRALLRRCLRRRMRMGAGRTRRRQRQDRVGLREGMSGVHVANSHSVVNSHRGLIEDQGFHSVDGEGEGEEDLECSVGNKALEEAEVQEMRVDDEEEDDAWSQGAIPVAKVRRARLHRERVTLEELSDEEVYDRYHLPRGSVIELYELLKDELEPAAYTNRALPGMVKLLSGIHFLATGSFQSSQGFNSGMAQPTFSKVLGQFLSAMKRHCQKFISFPKTRDDWQKVKKEFYLESGFSKVMGSIDCFDVALRPPQGEEVLYKNNSQFHSIKVQMVCDANMRIQNVFAGLPGSADDAYILHNSSVFRDFESEALSGGWLVGNSRYACRSWLMTPVAQPSTPEEQRYNESHKRAWLSVQCTLSMLKSRFRCLDHCGGGALQYSPQKQMQMMT